MKGVVILALVLGALGAGVWFTVLKSSMSDQGELFVVVLGPPDENNLMEFDVCVELGTATRAKPPVNERFEPQWDEWIDQRFAMRDSAGKKLPFTRIAHTMLIDERKFKHLPEFYVQYRLEPGKEYTLDFIPKNNPVRYRYKFTTSSAFGPARENFVPVEGEK